MADGQVRTPGRARRRPTAGEWTAAMAVVMEGHELHGELPEHVLEQVAASIGVTPSTIDRRYDEHLRELERGVGPVVLTDVEKRAISAEASLAVAQARLASAGRAVPLPLLERAVWRDGGDRALTALREAECDRRAASRWAGCPLCDAAEVAA